MQFSEIVGHDDIKSLLRSQADGGRIPHAQLFVGKQGVGKLPLAVAYAQYLNCAHPHDGDSCGECASCRQFARLEHPDLHFVFPYVHKHTEETCDDYFSSFRQWFLSDPYGAVQDWIGFQSNDRKKGEIYANESERIITTLSLKSYQAKWKTLIIWLPERMGEAGANKLLKTLEEPSPSTVLLLVSDNPDRLLATIRSRMQRVNVPALSAEQVFGWIRQHSTEVGEEDARRVARASMGSLSTAKQMMEDLLQGNKRLDDFALLMRTAWGIRNLPSLDQKGDFLLRLQEWSEKKSGESRDEIIMWLQYCQRLLRENFIYNFKRPELNYLSVTEESFSSKFAPFINEGNILPIMKLFATAERDIGQNVQIKIVLTDLALQLIMQIK